MANTYRLSPEAVRVINDWNERTYGRSTAGEPVVREETLLCFRKLSLPGETIDETIIRLFNEDLNGRTIN